MNITRMTMALLAAGFATITAAAPEQKPATTPADKTPAAKTGLRMDDPCAEPQTELKKKSSERKGGPRSQTEPKKP